MGEYPDGGLCFEEQPEMGIFHHVESGKCADAQIVVAVHVAERVGSGFQWDVGRVKNVEIGGVTCVGMNNIIGVERVVDVIIARKQGFIELETIP